MACCARQSIGQVLKLSSLFKITLEYTVLCADLNQLSIENCHRAVRLRVRGYSLQEYIELPPAYTREYIPLERESIPTCKKAQRWIHLLSVAKKRPDLLDCPIGLLIDYDCLRALKPTQVISGKDHEPYAVKTDLGWNVVGSITPASIIKILEADFQDNDCKEKAISQEDIQFLQQLDKKPNTTKKVMWKCPYLSKNVLR